MQSDSMGQLGLLLGSRGIVTSVPFARTVRVSFRKQMPLLLPNCRRDVTAGSNGSRKPFRLADMRSTAERGTENGAVRGASGHSVETLCLQFLSHISRRPVAHGAPLASG